MNDATHRDQDSAAELAELLTRASRRLRSNERNALAPYGLTFAQARALRKVVNHGPLRIGDLARLLEIVPRSATTRVDDLERTRLVVRSTDPSDRRSVIVSATTEGRELVARLRAERTAGAETMFAALSSKERSHLVQLLRALTAES